MSEMEIFLVSKGEESVEKCHGKIPNHDDETEVLTMALLKLFQFMFEFTGRKILIEKKNGAFTQPMQTICINSHRIK